MARPFEIRGAYFYRQRVPADVARKVEKKFIKESLNTRARAVARARFPAVAAKYQAYFAEVRRGVQTLTPEQCEAIAGEIYEDMIESGGRGRHYHMFHNLYRAIMKKGCEDGEKTTVDVGGGKTVSRRISRPIPRRARRGASGETRNGGMPANLPVAALFREPRRAHGDESGAAAHPGRLHVRSRG